jgi:Transposase DDE domain group 1
MKRSPKNLQINFSGQRLTHFGGLSLLQKFFQKIDLRSLLSQYIRLLQRNNRYTVAEEMLALIYPIALGLGRIQTAHLLKQNGVFQYLTGLPTYPNPTTLRRFLFRMAPLALPKLRTLHDRLLFSMIEKPKSPTRVIFDLDSTVLPLYGKQEMARVGYNPKKWGRPSYHPLLCFNGITKDFWHGELRPGDTHTATGILELLEISFTKLPSSVQNITIRADKGFYDHKTIEYLESRRALFVIVARLTKPITLDPAIPQLCKRLTDFGVYLSTNGMGKGIPFYSDQTPHPRRPSGTASPFLHGQVLLPGPRNQYETYSPQCMEVLQWSSLRRVDYQRTEGGLSVSENPNETFLSQRILFPHPFICLQSHKLVQTTVFTPGVPKYDA